MDNACGYNSYELSRNWFDFCFEHTDIVAPVHTALYFFCIEHCNRMGWKERFGLPTQMTMEAIGVRNWRTYKKAFEDLVEWKFIRLYQQSKNQYSATVIGIVKNTKAQSKALSKAIQKHSQKQCKSIAVIDKQLKPNNLITKKEDVFIDSITDINFRNVVKDWLDYKASRGEKYSSEKSLQAFHTKLMNLSGNDPDKARKIISESMANNWKGIFPLKTDSNNGSGSLPKRATYSSFD